MITPEIMPGELALGYFYRFRDINGYKTDKDAIKALKIKFGKAHEGQMQLALWLSRLLNINVQQFHSMHTLLPLLRAVVSYAPELPDSDTSEMKPIYANGIGHTNKKIESLKACACCMAEDIDYWGFAYYRREHQLIGVSFCGKHQILLSEISRSLHLNLDNLRPINNLELSVISLNDFNNPIISRYFTIVESWSMAERSIPVLQIVNVLQERARFLGIRWSNFGNKPLLSDLALKVCPRWWLETIFPNIDNKRPNKRISSLDGALLPQAKSYRSVSYAFALSILFDNADEALNLSYQCIDSKSRVIKSSLKSENGFWQGNKLTKKFILHRGSADLISADLGFDRSHTRKMMKKNGLPSLMGFHQNDLLAFMDFQTGMSLINACSKNSTDLQRLEILLRASSVKLTEALQSFTNPYIKKLPTNQVIAQIGAGDKVTQSISFANETVSYDYV